MAKKVRYRATTRLWRDEQCYEAGTEVPAWLNTEDLVRAGLLERITEPVVVEPPPRAAREEVRPIDDVSRESR